ncbi:hypothetical protein [Kitasatospora sp. NPDC094015]|uniref:hypothetical protein n=1 Tax=Kitasatospora sp. NPDC094015 TaxID=3155205 RepID=UPI00332DE7DA
MRIVSGVGAMVLLVGALAGCGDGAPSSHATAVAAGGSVAAAPGSLRLTAPETLPGGYRAQSPAKVSTDHPADSQPAGYESFDGSMVAKYTADVGGVLTIGGAWGTITDPDAVAASAITAMQSPRGTWTVPLTDVDAQDPNDPQGRLKCGVSTEGLLVAAVCLWGDHNTTGVVSFPPWPEGMPATLEQADAADRTRHIRDTMTVSK